MNDVIVVGGGPAGVSAALYTLRANINTRIFTHGGSSLVKAEKIDNYYGFEDGISGIDLYNNGLGSVRSLGGEIIEEEVVNITFDNEFIVKTNNATYSAEYLILANGVSRKSPNIAGLKELEGSGVSYCAVCDGFFYKGKDVVVIGNGEYAISEANELKGIANSVKILTNGDAPPNTDIITDTRKIMSIDGNINVDSITFEDGDKLSSSGVFVALGSAGGTDLARKIGAIISNNKIVVDENMLTNIPKLYAAGDCTGGVMQISKAVYQGMNASMDIIKQIRKGWYYST